ncbi:MAG TPA: DUF1214 domain-containing protein [Thermomicrobiales bacterium]|jgi:hypothetical protein
MAATNPTQYRYQTPIAPGVDTPDTLETSIGTLHLSDGYPDAETVQKIYHNQTRSMLQTDQQFPSASSQDEQLTMNADGSVDVYFGPEAPAGYEHNWVQTIPGKGWFVILRLYGPLESWFDQTWRPGEIEEVG